MELFKGALEKLKKSKEFKEWTKENKGCYLSTGFLIIEKEQLPWKIGYYDEKDNKITSFVVDKNITIEPEEEIFQKKKVKVKEIDLEKLKVELPNAVIAATNLQKEEYKGDDPIKIIAVLQNLDAGQVWNLIFITQKFNTLNIKIDSEKGDILEHKIAAIMDFRKE